MCQLCSPARESTMILLASKIIGRLPKPDDANLETIVGDVVKEHAKSIEALDAIISHEITGCAEVKEKLIQGIRKSLPNISIEDRLYLALVSGK